MIRLFLAMIAIVILSASIGWWFHGHPDKLVQYTGEFGGYIADHFVERNPVCPTGYTCTTPTPYVLTTNTP